MSPSAFGVRFRAIGGWPPLARARLDEARTLLRRGTAIAEVGGAVGYDSPTSFTRAFRRATGEAPGAYQRGQPRFDKRVRSH